MVEPRRPAPDLLVAHVGLGYQPIVCLSQGLTHGVGAVPVGHRDLPDASDVTSVVLGLVATTVATAGSPASVAVDLPGGAMGAALVDLVEQALVRHDVAPTSISLTLPAEDVVHDLQTSATTVAALRALGCRVGIDGVGSSFGSMRLLHALPIDFARIDASLVANMLADPATLAEVSGVLRLAEEAGVPTTAVGVDSYEQALWLRDLGCRFGTGPFFGNPSDWLVLPTAHRCGVA
jgi:EAL domain-containing protein (putative c-di-GMP-specific phosphodiesterase class I)